MGRGVSKSGGGGGGGGAGATYERIPLTVQMGSRYATKEEKQKARETISRFMQNAKAGDVYQLGGGFGSGGEQIEIVSHRRSPNGLGIKSVGSSRQAVAMSRSNVMSYIKNGARKVKRNRR